MNEQKLISKEELRVLTEFNRNIIWLKTRDLKKIKMVTANQLTKATGWDKEILRRKRDRKEIVFERSKTGGYRYQMEDLVEVTPS